MERSKNKNIILGIILALIGSILLLKNLDIIGYPLTHYLISWKTLLIVIGIYLLSAKNNITGGIIMVGLGTFFWLPEIFNHQVVLHQVFWPALLIIIGTLLLLKSSGLIKPRRHREAFTAYEEIKATDPSKTEPH